MLTKQIDYETAKDVVILDLSFDGYDHWQRDFTRWFADRDHDPQDWDDEDLGEFFMERSYITIA